MDNSPLTQFFQSIDICDLMRFLNSPYYLVFKYIYFNGSAMHIFSFMGENITIVCLTHQEKVKKNDVYLLTNPPSPQFFPSIDICDLMAFLNFPYYLVFRYIYFYGSVVHISSVIRENVSTSQKKI